MGGLAQESQYLAMGASKAFSLCRMLHAIRASLLAMAVASLLRCILGAAFRSHAPELKRSLFLRTHQDNVCGLERGDSFVSHCVASQPFRRSARGHKKREMGRETPIIMQI
jgi:hypothetical protein